MQHSSGFELGTLLEGVGEHEQALDAYKRGAASTGFVPSGETIRIRGSCARRHPRAAERTRRLPSPRALRRLAEPEQEADGNDERTRRLSTYSWTWLRLRPRTLCGRDPKVRAHHEGTALVVTTLAFAAASWAILMALAPLLQLRRMLQRRSSEDLSLGYLLVLLPGFLLWVLYGLASSDLALVVPNVLAFLVATLTAGCALVLRRGAPTAMKRRVLDEPAS